MNYVWTDLIGVLAQCPLLEDLTIRSSTHHKLTHNVAQPTTTTWPELASLKRLTFDGCSYTGMTLVLNYLNAPNIQEVVVARVGAAGTCPASLPPLTLPCRVRFYGARLSAISHFARRIANRQDVVLEVDLVDVLSLSIEPIDPEGRAWCHIGDGEESYGSIVAHWEWMTAHGKVDWSLPSGEIVSGNDSRALGFIEYHLDAHSFLLKQKLMALGGA